MVHKAWSGFAAFVIALIAGSPAFADNVPYRTPVKRAVVDSARMLDDAFRRADFDLAATRKTGIVPRFFVDRLPVDMRRLQGRARQEAFIRILLPLVAKANEIIAQQRDRYLEIVETEARGGFLSRNERDWLFRYARLYGSGALKVDQTARRADVIPPSLVIAHAIQASDWGANIPAVEDNALFGDYAPPGVTGFPSLLNGIMAYMHMVNTHHRFAAFRRQRANARAAGRPLTGPDLADAYKAAAPDLGGSLTTLIKTYDLAALDAAGLPRDTGATLVALVRYLPELETNEKNKDNSLQPSVYFDRDLQDPSDRFANPVPGNKYEELPR